MAISMSDNILNILKVVYRDGVQSLLFRNSPVLREIEKSRVEGKELRFAAMAGRGGACGGDYNVVKAQAIETARNVEFKTTPGKIFSALVINQAEILASKSRKGAYMTVLGNKVFAALEAERKQLAKALYGTGYGEFGVAGASGALTVGANTITLTEDAVIGIDIGTVFKFITPGSDGTLGSSATVGISVNTVTAIDGNKVTFTATNADSYAATDVLCYEGSRNPDGSPRLPIGLGAWIPTSGNRTGTAWDNYISVPLYGVNRSMATDRLAGQFVLSPASDYKIGDVISELFRRCRRAGAEVDLIVMNDKKYAEFMAEIGQNTTYWQSVNDGNKAKETGATKGFNDISYAFSTSFLNKVVDDPYCPYNNVYVLEKKNLELLTYSNVDKVLSDSISDNEPGKADPESEDGANYDQQGARLNIEDLVTIEPGVSTPDGPTHCVSFNIYGTFALFNTANSGVAVLQ